MATLPRFPNIPELESGQILGATYLNSLARGCEHLLGISHASYGLPHATAVLERLEITYGDMASYWLYHPRASDLLAYGLWVGNDSAGKTWYLHIDYYGDDAAWHTVAALSGTEGFPHVESGAIDLSGEAHITPGRLYQWRIQGRTSDASYHTQLQVMLLALRPVLSGWTAPPAIAAGASSETPLNIYRANLVALNDQMVSPTNTLSYCEEEKEHTDPQGDWAAYTRFAYRYRPNGLTVGIWGKIMLATWNWRVRFADSAGHEAVIYTSPDVATTPDFAPQAVDIDLTAGDAATALAAAGITLTLGAGYLVTIEAKRNSDDHALFLARGLCLRTSDGAPGGFWANNKLWAHKDSDVGPTQLNKVRTDLQELYTGGAEELWGENHAAWHIVTDARDLSGVHQKRYLLYYCESDDQPTLLYGADFGSDYGLPTGAGWLSFDLTSVALPFGAVYYVTNVECAFEADGVYGEA